MHCALDQYFRGTRKWRHVTLYECSAYENMSTSICESGVSHAKRGRPRSDLGVTRIKLKKDVFETWLSRKDSLGFTKKTHSEFAMYMLLNFCEEERGEKNFTLSPANGKNKALLTQYLFLHELHLYTYRLGFKVSDDRHIPPVHSTPIGIISNMKLFHATLPIDKDDVHGAYVEDSTSHQNMNISRMESVSTFVNPEFGIHAGDPSSESDCSSSESLDTTSSTR